jgi:hypothetical protein
MSVLNSIRYPAYDEKCRMLTQEEGIRFAGIIDKSGKLVAGGFRQGLVPLEGDQKRLEDFMKFVSQVSLRHDLDRTLGPINYLAARRDRIILVSFPLPASEMTLLISADKTLEIEQLASRIVNVFEREQARLEYPSA